MNKKCPSLLNSLLASAEQLIQNASNPLALLKRNFLSDGRMPARIKVGVCKRLDAVPALSKYFFIMLLSSCL